MRKVLSSLLCMFFSFSVFSPLTGIYVSNAINADIVVAKDGSGNFKTVQAAIDSIPSNNTKQVVVYVKNGTYQEVVTIRKDNVYLVGESNTAAKITYGNYAGKTKSDGTTYGTSGSASFYLYGKNCTLENIMIENSFDENSTSTTGTQAVAAYIQGDRNIIRNCVMTGNQDTLYANGGRQYYNKCKIIGDVDFIFGGATAVFDDCDIVSATRVNGGYITAASTDIADYGYLFLNCRITSNAYANSVYLGRPWRPNAYVVYKSCSLGAHIRTEGWTSMSGNPPENARFFEYKNTGPGAIVNSSRRQLTDAKAQEFTTQNILKGTDNWNPSALTPSTTPTPIPKPSPESGFTTYQAENAVYSQAVFEDKNAGYSGTGYINFDSVTGSYLEWTLNVPYRTKVKLNFKYSNGSTSNRPMEVKFNDKVLVSSMDFNPTSSWTSWSTNSVTAILGNIGNNTVRITSLSADGGPNIDCVEVVEVIGTATAIPTSTNTPLPTSISTPTLTPNKTDKADINGDKSINMADVIILALSFNAVIGDDKYVEARDLNGDGVINMADVIIIAAKFNTTI